MVTGGGGGGVHRIQCRLRGSADAFGKIGPSPLHMGARKMCAAFPHPPKVGKHRRRRKMVLVWENSGGKKNQYFENCICWRNVEKRCSCWTGRAAGARSAGVKFETLIRAIQTSLQIVVYNLEKKKSLKVFHLKFTEFLC